MEKKYTGARKKDLMLEVHPSVITDHAMKKNHTIDWKGIKVHVRDTNWTAGVVKEAVMIRKKQSPLHEQGWRCHQLPTLYSKLVAKKISPFIRHSCSSQ